MVILVTTRLEIYLIEVRHLFGLCVEISLLFEVLGSPPLLLRVYWEVRSVFRWRHALLRLVFKLLIPVTLLNPLVRGLVIVLSSFKDFRVVYILDLNIFKT